MLSSTSSLKSTESETSPWHGVGAVRCINLEIRPDRLRDVKTQFTKVGLEDKVEFFFATKSPKGGRIGCYESHRACIEEAYNKCCDTVLIFEDDVVFHDGWQDVVRECFDMIRHTHEEEVDVVHLGGMIIHAQKDCGTLWKGTMLLTHAYIMTRQGMSKYLKRMPRDYAASFFSHLSHDEAWGLVLPNMFIHKRGRIVDQNWEDTDNPWFPTSDLDSLTANWMQTKLSVVAFAMQSRLVTLVPMLPSALQHCFMLNVRFVPLHNQKDGTVHVVKGGVFAKLSGAVILLLSLFIVDSPPHGYLRLIPDIIPLLKLIKNVSNSIACIVYDVTTIHKANR